ncbi:F-box/FBD/LRR-repeat protein [Rosa sericea]
MEIDRISNLPWEVLDSILVLLALKQVVQTSILSKSWRHKWTCLSQFVIDDKFIPNPIRNIVARWRFIMKILRQVQAHNSVCAIEKFKLSAYCSPDRSDLDQWIQYIAEKGLNELILKESALFNRCDFRLPCSLFSCPQLHHLELSTCVINPPLESHIGFKSLRTLQLNKVSITSCVLERLIPNCPLLERLTLFYLVHPIFLRIQNPNLKYLEIHSKFEDVCLASSPSLLSVDVSLRWWDDSRYYIKSNLSRVVGHLHAIERLSLHSSFLEFLGCESIPDRLPSHLHHLTVFQLKDLRLDCMAQVMMCLCILRSAPNLEKLFLLISHTYSTPVEEFLETQSQSSNLNLPGLKTVNITAVEGFESNSVLTKFIKDRSPNLEQMTVLLY